MRGWARELGWVLVAGLLVMLLAVASRSSAVPLSSCAGRVSTSWSRAQHQLAPRDPIGFETCSSSGKLASPSELDARLLAREFDLLPAASSLPARCRAARPATVALRFDYRGGKSVTLLVQLGGCHLVTNGPVTRRASGRWAFVLRDLRTLENGGGAGFKVVHASGTPACSDQTAAGAALLPVTASSLPTSGAPFAVAVDRGVAFVSQTTTEGQAEVLVLSTSATRPRLQRTISIPGGSAAGETLTPNGKMLLVVTGTGIDVLSTARARTGSNPLLGKLTSPDRVLLGPIEVAVDPTGRYAFVSEEGSGDIAVYNLKASAQGQFRRSVLVGTIPLARAPVGMAFSSNGKWLYATSELARNSQGSLSVINVTRAERDPSGSVTDSVSAGCQPVRVVVSRDGRSVWVTARGSNAVENFSATKLRTNPSHSLIAQIRVGQSPVGLALINSGRQLVVGDSDRFQTPGAQSALSVLDVTNPGHPTLTGNLPAGGFPRDMALAPNGTLLIADYLGDSIQTIVTASLGRS